MEEIQLKISTDNTTRKNLNSQCLTALTKINSGTIREIAKQVEKMFPVDGEQFLIEKCRAHLRKLFLDGVIKCDETGHYKIYFLNNTTMTEIELKILITKDDIRKHVSSNCLKLRMKAGLSQSQVAKKLGMENNLNYAKMEEGANIAAHNIVNMALLFKVSLDDFLLTDLEVK
jgi:hypothetical protein